MIIELKQVHYDANVANKKNYINLDQVDIIVIIKTSNKTFESPVYRIKSTRRLPLLANLLMTFSMFTSISL